MQKDEYHTTYVPISFRIHQIPYQAKAENKSGLIQKSRDFRNIVHDSERHFYWNIG